MALSAVHVGSHQIKDVPNEILIVNKNHTREVADMQEDSIDYSQK